jgi:hypothetical protein
MILFLKKSATGNTESTEKQIENRKLKTCPERSRMDRKSQIVNGRGSAEEGISLNRLISTKLSS